MKERGVHADWMRSAVLIGVQLHQRWIGPHYSDCPLGSPLLLASQFL